MISFLLFFFVLSISFPSYIVSKDDELIYKGPFTFPSDEANELIQKLKNELIQKLNKPGTVITLLEGGGVPVGLNTNTTLQIDLLNETEKTHLLNKLMQPDIIYECMDGNKSSLQDVDPNAKYYSITINSINAKECIAIDSSSDYSQENEDDGLDQLRKYIKDSSKAKIERFSTNTKLK